MERKKKLQWTICLLAITTLFVIVCDWFVDQQVALWLSQHHFRSFKILKYFSLIPEIFIAVVPVFYIFVVIRFSFNRWTFTDQVLLTFANTIVITQLFKLFFKFIFGRYWPETWCNNPSYINNHEYGFHFFHLGKAYGAFPSGHAATLLAATTLLWLFFPGFWPLYLLTILLGITGILGMNYHFVSDIIAGGVLGYLTAYFLKPSFSWVKDRRLNL